ncbi:MAG: WhiB family transcriptional regulator [Acidimicrobiales bacterium]
MAQRGRALRPREGRRPGRGGTDRAPRLVGHEEGSSVRPARELDEQWKDHAACVGIDPDLFFPERGALTAMAKEVCMGCPVRQECLDYALAHGMRWGIWGGTTERQRRRKRQAAA